MSGKYKHTHSRLNISGRMKRRSLLRWVFAVIIAALLLIFFTGNKSLFKLHSLHKEKLKLQEQKRELILENERLKAEIEKLKKDKAYIEKVAREKYNMKKKHEEVYLVEPR